MDAAAVCEVKQAVLALDGLVDFGGNRRRRADRDEQDRGRGGGGETDGRAPEPSRGGAARRGVAGRGPAGRRGGRACIERAQQVAGVLGQFGRDPFGAVEGGAVLGGGGEPGLQGQPVGLDRVRRVDAEQPGDSLAFHTLVLLVPPPGHCAFHGRRFGRP